MTPMGIEPANFRFAPQCLNQPRNHVPQDLVAMSPFVLVFYLWIYQGSHFDNLLKICDF
jgi:hypothetical protein